MSAMSARVRRKPSGTVQQVVSNALHTAERDWHLNDRVRGALEFVCIHRDVRRSKVDRLLRELLDTTAATN